MAVYYMLHVLAETVDLVLHGRDESVGGAHGIVKDGHNWKAESMGDLVV